MNSETLMDVSTQLYQRGRDAMEKHEYEVAAALFHSSSGVFPHFKSLELFGECLLELGRSREAVVPLAAAAGLGNKASRALFLLARALSQQGRTQDAIEKLDLAIAVQPQFKAAIQLREQLIAPAGTEQRT